MGSPCITQLRAIDLGSGLPTAVVAKVLGELGVQVTRVSWPGDCLANDAPALDPSMAPWTTCTPDRVEELVARADICLCGSEGEAVLHGLTAEVLHQRFPELVVLDVVAEEAHDGTTIPAAELLVQARNGLCYEHFRDQPTQIAFAPATFGAALSGLLGLWTALLERANGGEGSIVRTSLQRGLTLLWPHLLLRTQHRDPVFDRLPPKDVQHLIYRCADGEFVQVVLGVPGALARLYRVLGVPVDVDPNDSGIPDLARGPASFFADRVLLEPYFKAVSRSELLDRLTAVGLPAAPVLPPGGCFDDEQVVVMDYLRRHPDGRRFVGNVLRLSHFDTTAPAPIRGRAAGGPSLRGIRVVDIGNFVAGPFTSRLLSDLGADVIQVEAPAGMSNLTGARNVWVCTRGKRSMRVDLKSVAGRAVLDRLLTTADVLLHNFRPGVAERLGLDAATLRTQHPRLIHLHTSAFGDCGPRARQPGFDMVMQALAGHEVRAGGVGNDPLWYRSPYIDYGTGVLGAIAVVVALYQRALCGGTVEVKNTLLGTALLFALSTVQAPDGQVTGAPLLAADRKGFHPTESLYQTSDDWIAVWAPTEADAQSLSRALGLAGIGRRDGWDQCVKSKIAGRLRAMTAVEAVAVLKKHHVWAVRCERDPVEWLSGLPSAWEVGLVARAEDPQYGRVWGCFGPPVLVGQRQRGSETLSPAPISGSDTRQVLAELGYEVAEVENLLNAGICRDANPAL